MPLGNVEILDFSWVATLSVEVFSPFHLQKIHEIILVEGQSPVFNISPVFSEKTNQESFAEILWLTKTSVLKSQNLHWIWLWSLRFLLLFLKVSPTPTTKQPQNNVT